MTTSTAIGNHARSPKATKTLKMRNDKISKSRKIAISKNKFVTNQYNLNDETNHLVKEVKNTNSSPSSQTTEIEYNRNNNEDDCEITPTITDAVSDEDSD